MKHSFRTRITAAALTLALTAGGAGLLFAARAAEAAARAPLQSGVTVLSNAKAAVDASNLSEGFVQVKYTGGKQVRIKVQIAKSGGPTYTYNLNNTGSYETFPLTEGDGVYTIKVLENTTGTKYAQAYSTSVTLTLRTLPALPLPQPVCEFHRYQRHRGQGEGDRSGGRCGRRPLQGQRCIQLGDQ